MGAHKPHKLWDLQTVMHTYMQRHVLYSLKMWHSHMTMTNYSICMRLGSRRQTDRPRTGMLRKVRLELMILYICIIYNEFDLGICIAATRHRFDASKQCCWGAVLPMAKKAWTRQLQEDKTIRLQNKISVMPQASEYSPSKREIIAWIVEVGLYNELQ